MRLRTFLCLGFIAAVVGAGTAPATPAPRDPARHCAEDRPCWNWATMGNRTRSVRTLSGNIYTVDACEFQELAERARLTYYPMKGDLTAMNARCYGREPRWGPPGPKA